MEHLDSNSIVKRKNISNEEIIQSAVALQQGQTMYQNDTFVVGSAITPYKKVQQALLELDTRQHGLIELDYKLRLCRNGIKKYQRAIEYELKRDPVDDLEVEKLSIELEKAQYDETLYLKHRDAYEREMNDFCDMIRKHMDPEKDMDYYVNTNEEEDRKYWISRMAKQAAVDVHTIGRLGSGNLDSILNMPAGDQLLAIKGAVEHATLLTAGVEKLQQQLMPEVRKILNSDESTFKVPQLMSADEVERQLKLQLLPEVKNDSPKEKLRLQSSDKPQA